jgi:hypothetical protein
MNRRSFFTLLMALFAGPSLLLSKRRDETHTITAAEMPSHSHILGPPIPSGTIMAYAGTEPPPGWTFCDGANYSRGVRDPGHSHSVLPAVRDPGHSHSHLPPIVYIQKI